MQIISQEENSILNHTHLIDNGDCFCKPVYASDIYMFWNKLQLVEVTDSVNGEWNYIGCTGALCLVYNHYGGFSVVFAAGAVSNCMGIDT